MPDRAIGRRAALLGMTMTGVGARALGAHASGAHASDAHASDTSAPGRLTLVTNWYAQPELGGFYQARESGLYRAAGLDVTIRSGGPQVNTMQLLLAGACDVIVGQPDAAMVAALRGIPVVTIGACFQKCMTGFLTHPDIGGLSDLKGHPLLISTEGRSTYWPWLKRTYGFTDAQAGVYTYNLQPFVHDPALAIQSFLSSEPYAVRQMGVAFKYFLFADAGYPTYTNALLVSRRTLETRADALRRFLAASARGWLDYLYHDPAAGDAAILRDNPANTADHMAWSRRTLRDVHAMGAPGQVLLGMSAARWARIHEVVALSGGAADGAAWRDAYTTALSDALTDTVPA
ncbi:ABC transporter substrate-binding protein [Nguyenibacter sp. L1]|uniref:ABC transporter substrate-binding protein n=1 Tax=Nguyenibacter sp. L1 TaxID=3049350 RepID=UPI002B49DBBA|nr:ABC transporter substrate-binding protein [Nguyenibacter sp. L1]WRH88771.1 ABC transporter substrate-binding protein [Nguyenibacter sp. L1]